MKLTRRKFLHLVAGVATLPAVSRIAGAQAYPTRPIRWIVPFPPGGPVDVIARMLGQQLSERVGQPVIVENRPGAGGNLGTEAVAKAAPDGLTLLHVSVPNAINATLYEKLNFDFVRDIAPIASFLRVPGVMVVNPSLPTNTVPEFIAYAKANPGKLNMASGGNGTPQQVYGELFKMMTGIDMLHVPYRGGAPAMTDLLGGQVHVIFEPIPTAIGHIRAGRLRSLAVTTAARLEVLPDVPAVAETVPGYEGSGWQGLGAPRDTPTEIIARLNKEINAALADPKISARIADLGGTVLLGTPADFGKLIAEDTVKWGKVVKFSGAKIE